ncbi:MAG TPA: PEP-utilizing enzyme [Candidatus Acidoferrum sp.]|nr:PEP-utilizing enzyme [Candidatus Acidoferrum sp.]
MRRPGCSGPPVGHRPYSRSRAFALLASLLTALTATPTRGTNEAATIAVAGDLLGHVIGSVSRTNGTVPVKGAAIEVTGRTPAGPWKSVSPGVVTGRARLVLRTDNHAQVLPGEILVAPFTDPAWTPYLVSAAGVVMDQGGVLSHGSIVAREYGLPAVTNLGSATQLIRTGDWIQVDGDGGRVTILQRGG